MLKFRYLLIVFLFNFFLKSAYSADCNINVSNTGPCTGPLNVTVSDQTITNSGTISLSDGSKFRRGISNSGSNNIITNLNTINLTLNATLLGTTGGYTWGINNPGANNTVTNSGTINLISEGEGTGSIGMRNAGNSNTFINSGSGSINATSISSLGYAIDNESSNLRFENSGTVSGTSTTSSGLGFKNRTGGSTIVIVNSGTIRGTSTSSLGYAIDSEGTNLTFSNSSTGTVSGTSTTSTGVGFRDRIGGAIIENSGTISGTSTSGAGYGLYITGNNSAITNTNTGTITGSTAGIFNSGTGVTINNSGTITGGTNSINNSGVINLTLNQGSKLIGTITNSGTLNITSNVGAAKSYAYSGTVTSLTDSNNRPSALGSAAAINIGSMEVSGENLYQKTANITDAIDRNVKNNKDTWVEPYYSESTRDSGGDSSQIRQFKNNKQGINAGFKTENSATPLQVIFNVDQTKNNIDSSEHIINSDGVMIGLISPKYTQYEGFDVSVKGLVGYANSKTDRKILDNTSSTGERTLTGEYDSYYAVVGSALSKNYNLDKDLNANLIFGVDLTSEFRDSYSENLYFKYSSLELIQLQPRIQSEFIKTTGKDSNVFLTAGVGAREVLSGKTQKYSMNNTGVSFTAPNSGDYYASLAAGTNMNVAANVNFYALVSAKMSDRDTETYQASLGLKGTF
jgi:hypothetical protein